MSNPIYLGVNIDHIATLRQTRGTSYPDPVHAAMIAEQSGADGITLHLREDRRHIQDRDVDLLKETLQTRMNLEMAATAEMLAIAKRIRPAHCCLVPEKRKELTTEGGLNVLGQLAELVPYCTELGKGGIDVSLFIDPDIQQIDAAIECKAPTVEIHTGCYADASSVEETEKELARIHDAVRYAHEKGLIVNAGHGLHYHNVQAIAAIPEINELNIGHSIIAQASLIGLADAVMEMKLLMQNARM